MTKSYHDLITVDVFDNQYFYNGYQSTYEALMQCDPDFKNISFVDKILIAVEAMNQLTPVVPKPTITPKKFLYKFMKQDGILLGVVFEVGAEIKNQILFGYSGNDIFDEGIMKDKFDVEGLHEYLISRGELLPEDSLFLVHEAGGLKTQLF